MEKALYIYSSMVCYAGSSMCIQKALRSKLALSKLKYFGLSGALAIAGSACSERAEKLTFRKEQD